MYHYHNNLTAAHAACSPWWAWPLDLKPVWFYQGGFAGDRGRDLRRRQHRHLVAGHPGDGIRRLAGVPPPEPRPRPRPDRLPGQWVAWARIDRAAFQYHYYTSLPFMVLALAYFLGELWHGASRRTWLLARVAAAVAIIGPAILWVLRRPAVRGRGVEAVNPGSQACRGEPGQPRRDARPPRWPSCAGSRSSSLVRQLVRLGRGRARTAGRSTAPRPRAARRHASLGAALLARRRLLRPTNRCSRSRASCPSSSPLLSAVPLLLVASGRDRPRRPAVRGRADRRGRRLVRRPVPEHRGAAAAVDDRQRLPGAAADLPVSVPVPREHVDRNGAIAFAEPAIRGCSWSSLVVACVVVGLRRMGRGGIALAEGPRRAGDGPAGERGAA